MAADSHSRAAEIGCQPLFDSHARQRRVALGRFQLLQQWTHRPHRALRHPQRVAPVDLLQRIQRAHLRQHFHFIFAEFGDAEG